MHPTGNPKLCDWLVTKGLISAEQREAALGQQQLLGGRIEEALIDVRAIGELSLLKFLANMYRTRFVSTEKLAKAQIDRATLERVPKKLADQSTVFPVMYDRKTSTLSVVSRTPTTPICCARSRWPARPRRFEPSWGVPWPSRRPSPKTTRATSTHSHGWTRRPTSSSRT
jgi:hypothetical protein